MCLLLFNCFLEPLYRLSTGRFSSSRRPCPCYPEGYHGSTNSSKSSLPPYPGYSPHARRHQARYEPHPLFPHRPASTLRSPVLVQDPRVDRIIGALNGNGGLGTNGTMGMNPASEGGIGNGLSGRGGIPQITPQGPLPQYGIPHSPERMYTGPQGGGGFGMGAGLAYDEPRMAAGGGMLRPAMDAAMGNRTFENAFYPNMVNNPEYYGGHPVPPYLQSDHGYGGGFQPYQPDDVGMGMGQMNMHPPRAELFGARPPRWGEPAPADMDMMGFGMQPVSRQDVFAGHAQVPQQPASWGQQRGAGGEMASHSHAKEDVPRSLGLGGRGGGQERDSRTGLGLTKQGDGHTERDRGQQKYGQSDTTNQPDRRPTLGESLNNKPRDTGKERERARLGSPSRRSTNPFSGLRSREVEEARTTDEAERGQRLNVGRPPEYETRDEDNITHRDDNAIERNTRQENTYREPDGQQPEPESGANP